MELSLLWSNLLSPPVLFFFMGLIAVAVKSDIQFPEPLPKLFSLYLLFAIGFKGGHEIYESGFSTEVVVTLFIALTFAAIVPLYAFAILRTRLDAFNAAAIAASYGSISAVTFITAATFLGKLEVPFSGHMVAALALMESPAIVVGLVLVERFGDRDPKDEGISWPEILQEAFFNESVFMILGSLVIGFLSGEQGWTTMRPFLLDIFYGVLAFFLLDMGISAGSRFNELRKSGWFLIGFSVLMPLFNGAIAIAVAHFMGMSPGNALLLTVLFASASYVAVPAAMSLSVPEANPSFYISMALALTFPFNIIVGIPLYLIAIKNIWSLA